ncbi:hypothetical protein FH968_23295 [Buttiauxella sp. B2]|uniref:hypothetical protein n=1 Tax=Buttiauxella sp. B2 TaxID=2587812 RepID=UPI001121F07C|nr:hypothetical protein [Buttiauxella sp. B2]TNV09569.1 hypothetical protein FH968_23295 [Buttiauxella sp. B2]
MNAPAFFLIKFSILFFVLSATGCSTPKYSAEAEKQLYALHGDIDKKLTEWQGEAPKKSDNPNLCENGNYNLIVPSNSMPIPQVSLVSGGEQKGDKDKSFYENIDSGFQVTETLMQAGAPQYDSRQISLKIYGVKTLLDRVKITRARCTPEAEYYQAQRDLISTLMANLYMYSDTIKNINSDSK